jgi:hypothetical protein
MIATGKVNPALPKIVKIVEKGNVALTNVPFAYAKGISDQGLPPCNANRADKLTKLLLAALLPHRWLTSWAAAPVGAG